MPLMSRVRKELEGEEDDDVVGELKEISDTEFMLRVWYIIREVKIEVREVKRTAEKHNGRLGKVERFMWVAIGIGLATTTMATVVAIDLGG